MNQTEVERAFTEHHQAVYRFAWRMSTSPEMAEDVTQDVFVGLLRGDLRFEPSRGTLRGFLLGVTRNLTLKRLRAESRWASLDEEQVVARPLDLDGARTGELVGSAVRALPPLQRDVLILAEYEDLSLEEIAHTVEATVGAVKARLHRARENLRRMLAPLRAESSQGVRIDGTA